MHRNGPDQSTAASVLLAHWFKLTCKRISRYKAGLLKELAAATYPAGPSKRPICFLCDEEIEADLSRRRRSFVGGHAFLSLAYEISAEQVRNRNARPPCQFMNARRGASRVLHRPALGIITFECAVGIQRRYKSKHVRDTLCGRRLRSRTCRKKRRFNHPRIFAMSKGKKEILSSCSE